MRESEDDETPQRAFFASEEAHREPAESVVYFHSGKRHQPPLILLRSLYQLQRMKSNNSFLGGRVTVASKIRKESCRKSGGNKEKKDALYKEVGLFYLIVIHRDTIVRVVLYL